jgi:predicted RNA-binding Zn-ribbon protein involved in translation (DUF1610 family)
LIYGAGSRGVAAVRELFGNSASGLRPIGFIDDDIRKRGKLVSGLLVFGTERELEGIIRQRGAEAVLVASEKISEDRVERAGLACRQAGAGMFRLDIKVERFSGGAPHDERVLSTQPPPQPSPVGNAKSSATPAMSLHLWCVKSCPSCGGHEVHRSKARSLYERFRKAHTPKRLFRCHHCGWRGWLAPLDSRSAAVGCEVNEVDLSGIDGGLVAARLVSSSGDR